jgi:WD40 repeat protein/serine/threonine protein kinase
MLRADSALMTVRSGDRWGGAMSTPSERARSVFLEAIECHAPEQWPAFLDRVCVDDMSLRTAVERLLRAQVELGAFRESIRQLPVPTLDLPATDGPGTVLGPYKLIEPIGEGGMGTVYLAQQQEPVRRLVALKVIKAGMDSRQVLARFEAERQALALMDHPNIARVLDGGTTEHGRPYFVMELVKGVPITKYCDEHRLSVRHRLELFSDVCRAVQHAHQKGVIHRDLKPTNVLVAQYDGKPVPKVIDFGVAKAAAQPLTEKTLVTGFGAIIGTLEYMAPEQAEVNQLDIDTRSDIYSLGVLLYELLTGTTPLERKRTNTLGILEALRVIREEEIPTLSNRLSETNEMPTIAANRGTDPVRLTKLVRGELDWIVMKALEKDRNRRYETATGLATDVQRFLAGEAVQAAPPSAGYRLRKFVQRNRREVLITGVTTVAAAGGVAGLAVSRALIARALHSETEAKERERLEAYFQRITVAHRELSMDNLAAALRALNECPEDLRGWEWNYLMRLCKVDPLVIQDRAEVNGVAFSSDGERLASADGDGRVRIWNSRTGEEIQQIPDAHTDSVVCVAFHPKGSHLASRGADKQVKVWDLAATEKPLWKESCDALRKFGTAQTVVFSPDGKRLVVGSDGVVRIWDWENGRVLQALTVQERHAMTVAFTRDGRQLASASTGDNVKFWDLAGDGRVLRSIPPHGHPVGALAFSPDGRWLAEANLNRCVNLWDTSTGELLRRFPHDGNVLGVAFSPDGRRLASSDDKIVRVWDPTTGREILGLRGHQGMCGCVAFSPDGQRLASCSKDRTIRFWDARPLRGDEGQEAFSHWHGDEIRSVVVSPNGGRIVAAGTGSLVKTWSLATGELGNEFNLKVDVTFCLAWQPPDGRRIALACWDGQILGVKVWDVQDGQITSPLPPVTECYAVAFSPDGRYLVTGEGSSGIVKVWDAQNGNPVSTIGTHEREIRGLVFSPDRKYLASASGDGRVKLWDATRLDQKQEPLHTPLQAWVPGPGLNVAFSPDSHWLASGGEENTVLIWDVQTSNLLQTLPGHTGDVYAVAVSPDGRWVASGGEDSTVKVWDCRNKFRLARSFRGHSGLVSSLAFSSDSRLLVSGSRDKTVKVWNVTQLGGAPMGK